MHADAGRSDVAPGPEHRPATPFDAAATVAAYDAHEPELARAARDVAQGFAGLVHDRADVGLTGRAVR